MFEAVKSENAPKAIGPYSPAVKIGDFIYLSGQIPVDPLTGDVVSGGIPQQTHQVFQNIISLLEEVGLNTEHIVKTTVFLTDMKNFGAMNEVYATYFDEPFPARSCVEVGALPKGVDVEIECIAIDDRKYAQQTGCKACPMRSE